jgi:hypothetical protein
MKGNFLRLVLLLQDACSEKINVISGRLPVNCIGRVDRKTTWNDDFLIYYENIYCPRPLVLASGGVLAAGPADVISISASVVDPASVQNSRLYNRDRFQTDRKYLHVPVQIIAINTL